MALDRCQRLLQLIQSNRESTLVRACCLARDHVDDSCGGRSHGTLDIVDPSVDLHFYKSKRLALRISDTVDFATSIDLLSSRQEPLLNMVFPRVKWRAMGRLSVMITPPASPSSSTGKRPVRDFLRSVASSGPTCTVWRPSIYISLAARRTSWVCGEGAPSLPAVVKSFYNSTENCARLKDLKISYCRGAYHYCY